MSQYKAYPAYKDSGAQWLGTVPEHWDVRTVKSLARSEGGAGFPDDEQGQSENPIPFFKVAELASGLRYTTNTVTEETAKRLGAKIFPSGTLVFAKVGAALLLNRRCLLEMPACLDNNMMALLPGEYESQWLFWVFSILDMGLIANPGAVPSINQEQVGGIRLGVPSIAEQRSIARALDREISRIDALVEKKTRFIELLREKRQALITQAVTKGLDPNVRMKDSGVEWLGEVPEHWIVCNVQHVIAKIEQGWSPDCLNTPAEDGQWGVVKSGCVNGGTFAPEENKALPVYLSPIPEYEIKAGDVLMSRASGSPELIGSIALVKETPEKLMLSDKIFRLKCSEKMLPSFFAMVMGACVVRAQVEQSISGADGLANNLPQSRIKKFVLPCPPVKEQLEIALFTDAQICRLQVLLEKTERSIELLKERRTALITAAVTGQIDLREAV